MANILLGTKITALYLIVLNIYTMQWDVWVDAAKHVIIGDNNNGVINIGGDDDGGDQRAGVVGCARACACAHAAALQELSGAHAPHALHNTW